MNVDALLLSRIQFVWVIAFHILLPAFTVGLACYIATLEVLWWRTQRDVYRRLSAFWLKIFAVSFGMGVVSGIVMPFQFGTNWSRYVDTALNVVGSLMAYEVVTAFFLEAAFLGVLLFGRKLVPQWAHVMSAVLVALGPLGRDGEHPLDQRPVLGMAQGCVGEQRVDGGQAVVAVRTLL